MIDRPIGCGAVLGINVHLVGIPQDDFIPRVAGQVQHLGALVGVAVVGEEHDPVAVTVQHATVLDVAVEQNQLGTVALPVDRRHNIAVGGRLHVPNLMALAVVQVDDALVLPVGGGGNLQTAHIRAVVGYTDALAVAVDIPGQDVTVLVHDHETLPAGDNSQQLLIDIRVKLANDDFIRVIGVDGQLPLQFAVAADHVVAAENFILAVAVEVVGIGEVAGVVVGELPQQVEVLVVHPQAGVTVLDEDIAGMLLAGDVHNADSINVQPIKCVLLELDAQNLIRRVVVVGRIHAAQQLTGAAVQDHDLEISGKNDLVVAIVVDIVDLERQVAGRVLVHRQGRRLPHLPQHLAGLDIDGCQAADVAVALLEHALLVLCHDEVPVVAAHQMAEANLPRRSEVLEVDDLVQLGAGVVAALFGQAGLLGILALDDAGGLLRRGGDEHVRVLGGHKGRQRHLAVGVAVVLHSQQLFAVDGSGEGIALTGHAHRVVLVAVVLVGGLGQHRSLFFLDAPELHLVVIHKESVVHQRRLVTEQHTSFLVAAKGAQCDSEGVVLPAFLAGSQHRADAVGQRIAHAGLLHVVYAVGGGDEPAGAAIVAVCDGVIPLPAVTWQRAVMILTHCGMFAVKGQRTDRERLEIILE